MKKLLFLFWINIFAIGFAQVKSPNEFIPTYGKQITLYHQVEDYFNHLTTQTPYVTHQKYGETSEHRNLKEYSCEELRIVF